MIFVENKGFYIRKITVGSNSTGAFQINCQPSDFITILADRYNSPLRFTNNFLFINVYGS